MDAAARVRLPLLLLRLSVFVVMLAWPLVKFVDPARSAGIFKKFYHLPDIGAPITYTLGGLEVLLLLGFVAGFQKRLTYGAVLLFHAISTVSSYQQYVSAFEGNNLLFYAAWPMLAACFALYALRDLDTLGTVKTCVTRDSGTGPRKFKRGRHAHEPVPRYLAVRAGDHEKLGVFKYFFVALFLALVAASLWIAWTNWREDPTQRTGVHLTTWFCRILIGCMWFQGCLWKLPLPISE